MNADAVGVGVNTISTKKGGVCPVFELYISSDGEYRGLVCNYSTLSQKTHHL